MSLKEQIKADILRVNNGKFENIDEKVEEVYKKLMEHKEASRAILFIPSDADEDNPHMVLYNYDTGTTIPFRKKPKYLVKFCIENNISVVDFTDADKSISELDQVPLSSDELMEHLEQANPAIFNRPE